MPAVTRRIAVTAACVTGLVLVVCVTVVSADSGADLPKRSAAELLARVRDSHVAGLSGTVMQSAELGPIGWDGSGAGPAKSDPRQIRLWFAAPDRARVAVLDDVTETDLIRNGSDVWTWSSDAGTATHHRLAADDLDHRIWPPSGLDSANPAESARQVLAAVEPDTRVSTDGTVEVADRGAYQLVLEPRQSDSLIGKVVLAVDAETGVPLRTQVMAVGAAAPVFDVAFTWVEFRVPDDDNFRFTAPAGVEIVEDADGLGAWGGSGGEIAGSGWNQVLVTDFDLEAVPVEPGEPAAFRWWEALPEVSGDWGEGRLLTSPLLSVLITDDTLLAGAVTPDRLFEVAGSR